MLFQKLKDLLLQARLNKSPLALLYSTMIGDLQKFEKNGGNVDDTKVIGTIKTFIESATEMKKYGHPSADAEIAALSALLPQQMTQEELAEAVQKSGGTNMGEIMKYLKSNHGGLYDGKMAQVVVKLYLEGIQ